MPDVLILDDRLGWRQPVALPHASVVIAQPVCFASFRRL